MKSTYKKISINTPQQQEIKHILIEQAHGEKEISVEITTVKVLHAQSVIKTIYNQNNQFPELEAKVYYTTPGGIYDSDALSGLHIAEDVADISSIELNFICTEGSNEGCLIPIDFRYPENQEIENRCLSKISDYMAPYRYPIQLDLGEALHQMQLALIDITGNNPFACED